MDALEVQREARRALAAQNPRPRLRSLAQRGLAAGVPADEIVTALEHLRASVTDRQEDEVLGLMDALVGWCGPHERLCA
jgi:hypothetical protein